MSKKKPFDREKFARHLERMAWIASPESSFVDEGGTIKRPMCNVTPEDVDCPFGHAGGKRFPYLSDEDWKAAGN